MAREQICLMCKRVNFSIKDALGNRSCYVMDEHKHNGDCANYDGIATTNNHQKKK